MGEATGQILLFAVGISLSPFPIIAVVLAPGALTGKARFLMRVAAPYVAKELS